MKPYYRGLLILACIVASCKKDKNETTLHDTVASNYTICAEDSWVDDADFQAFSSNICFEYNNKLYVPRNVPNTDFPEPNVVNIFDGSTWTQKPCVTPFGTAYANNAFFTIGSKGYSTSLHSHGQPCPFYEYNIITNSWTRKADFPGEAFAGAYFFSANGKGYIVGGDDNFGDFTNENWEYNPANNTWTKRKGLPLNRAYGRGFSIGNKGYIIGGTYPDDLGFLRSLLEYDPATNEWTTKAMLPGEGRRNPAAFAIDGDAYAGGGYANGEDFVDFYKYNVSANSWTRVKNMPLHNPRTTFALNGKGYFAWSKYPLPAVTAGLVKYNPKYCITTLGGVPVSNSQ